MLTLWTFKNQLFQKMKKTAGGILKKLLNTKFQLNRTIGSRDTPRTDRQTDRQTDTQTAIQKPLFRTRGAR